MKGPFQKPQPLGLFAGDLYRRSDDYFEAFERLADSPGRELLFPMYFMLAHAFELLFKSYLATLNLPKVDIRGLNHDLVKLRERCENQKMPTVPDLDIYVATLHEMNRHDDFRYPMGYNLTVPPPKDCLKIAREQQKLIAPLISHAHVLATVENAASTRHLKGRKVQWSD
jgi:hypothetical protein